MGVLLPDPAGAEPQVALTASLGLWAPVDYRILAVNNSSRDIHTLGLVGTTDGTEVQALSKVTKLVLDCLGMDDAGTA